jgi:outer membrane receptor protein involved in Fe transport
MTDGMQGLFRTSIGYGKGFTPDALLRLDYHKKRISLTGSYSFLRTNQYRQFTYFNSATSGNNIRSGMLNSENFPVQRNHNLDLSVSYHVNNKTTLNSIISVCDNRRSINSVNDYKMTGSVVKDTSIKINDIEISTWKHIMTNLNVQHVISSNQRLSLNTDFLYYFNSNPVQLNSEYFDEKNEQLFSSQFRSIKKTPVRFWVLSGDYATELDHKISIVVGAKATLSKFQNNLIAENFNDVKWQKDMASSSVQSVNENIGAVYSSIDYRPDTAVTISSSLRYEYTQANMTYSKNVTSTNHKYGKVFPSLSVTRTMGEGQSFFLSYNSGIIRPKFNDLARSIVYFGPTKMLSGNPDLLPAFFHYLRAGYTRKRYTLSLFYDRENGAIAWFKNLRETHSTGVNVSIPLRINSWWTMRYTVVAAAQVVSGTCDNTLFEAENFNIKINAMQRFILPRNWSVELSGFYQSATFSGLYMQHALGSFNAVVKKKFATGTLMFSANDIFTTNKLELDAFHPVLNQVDNYCFLLAPATFQVSYAIDFGKSGIQKINKRNTGSEDEQARIKYN